MNGCQEKEPDLYSSEDYIQWEISDQDLLWSDIILA